MESKLPCFYGPQCIHHVHFNTSQCIFHATAPNILFTKRHRVTVSSEQIAESCDPHMIAVNSPNIRPSTTSSSDTTRMNVGENAHSAQMSHQNNVQLIQIYKAYSSLMHSRSIFH